MLLLTTRSGSGPRKKVAEQISTDRHRTVFLAPD
jgi:hypothetical protein